MKKIVCDLCGESDFLKVSGFFECQVCGAKYTIEEARNMFVEVDGPSVSQKANPVSTQAPVYEEEEEKSVAATPQSIVKKVNVQPVSASNDSQSVKRIVSTVKKNTEARESQVSKGNVVVKKVVTQQKPVQVKKPQGPVKAQDYIPGVGSERIQMIENLFILAQNAYDSENFFEAENYANRIIELDATNSDAWLMKGNCAGKQTQNGLRLLESINSWNTCLTNSSGSEFEDYQFTVRTNCIDIAVAYVLKSLVEFKNEPGERAFKIIKDSIDSVEPMMRKANQTFGVEIVTYEDKLASNINALVTAVSKSAIQAFGKKPEQQTDEAYARFVEVQDACILVWDYLMDLAKKHGTVTAILSNIVKIEEAIIRNCGHKVSGTKIKDSKKCSLSERMQRLEKIKKSKKKLEDKFVDIRKRDRVDQKIKNEKYWEEHQDEKEELLRERQKLDHEIFELENAKLKMPELAELRSLEEQALRFQILKDNQTYSNKERAQFMEQLTKTRKLIVTKKREISSRLNPIEDKIEKYKKRMFNIDSELNMNR